MNLTLVCWSCGEKLAIEVNRAPAFAFELASLATQAGWIGVIDLEHYRSLVFCCKDHETREIKKNGSFRLRPKKHMPRTQCQPN